MNNQTKIISCTGKLLGMILLSFSISFCDGDSGNGGPVSPLTCEINGQVYNAGTNRCECPGEQFLNSNSTACVSSCPDDEVKPSDKDKCERRMVCTTEQVFNPSTNTCIEECEDGQIPDTTVDPLVCISLSNCRSGADKFVNVAENACITKSACTTTTGQVANTDGDCEVCEEPATVRNADKTMCINDAKCTITEGYANINDDCTDCTKLIGDDGDFQTASTDKTKCISAGSCISVFGWANVNGNCTDCTSKLDDDGAQQIANSDKTMCIDTTTCITIAGNANIESDCTDCTMLTGSDGESQVTSPDKSMCIDAKTCTDIAGQTNVNGDCVSCADRVGSSDNMPQVIASDGGSCIDMTACTNIAGYVVIDSSCTLCQEPTPIADIDKMGCIDSSTCTSYAGGRLNSANMACIIDTDMDDIIEANDSCPNGTTGVATTIDPAAATADPDNDGCKNSEDIDDDNNGLIEISTFDELNKIRNDLAGRSYQGMTAGCPSGRVSTCAVNMTGCCGYELISDIDANASCMNYDGTNGAGLTPGTCGPGTVAWELIGDCGTNDICGTTNLDNDDRPFTGIFDGGGHKIRRLYHMGSNTRNQLGGLFGHARDATIRNVFLEESYISVRSLNISNIPGRNYFSLGGGLVGYISNNVRISNSIVTGYVTASGEYTSTGGLVGFIFQDGSIRNSYATVDVSTSVSNQAYVGGLVGYMNRSISNDSYATGDVSVSGSTTTYVGGLVGYMNDSISNNSYATGDVSVSGLTTYVGGLVGQQFGNAGNLNNSYATGDVAASATGLAHSGGLLGFSSCRLCSINNSYATGYVTAFGRDAYSGGLLGLFPGNVSNSYATGDVATSTKEEADVGGLAGVISGVSITRNSYATGDVFAFSSSSSSTHQVSVGGLVGVARKMSNRIRDSYATGDIVASSTRSGGSRAERIAGGLVGRLFGDILNSYINSNATQTLNNRTRRSNRNENREVGSSDPGETEGVTAITLRKIQGLSDSMLSWDNTNHWYGVGIAGNFPLLRYADNPHTNHENECRSLPGYGNNDTDKVRCGDILPYQELYRASGNVIFSNTTIGVPTSSPPEFFYNVDGTTVTVTYNLATGVTLMASGVEKKDGSTASSIVSWAPDFATDGTTGQVTDIDASETFWLALTFQQDGVTHKVRWKFVRPSAS